MNKVSKRIVFVFLFCLILVGQGLWAQVEMMLTSDVPTKESIYGFAVDIYENTALVGAYHEEPNIDDVDFNGAAYIYNWDGAYWNQTQKIPYPMDVQVMEVGFGYDVVLNDSVALIAAPWDYTGYNVTGAVYYYHNNGTEWEMGQKIKPSWEGGLDDFGISSAIDGEVMVVGAPATDIVLGTSEPTEMDYGAAYVYRWNGVEWVEEQMLRASDATCFDHFGDRVAIDDDVIAVAAYTGAVEDTVDIHAKGPGQVYIFHYNGSKWVEEQILTSDDAVSGDWFGRTVALQGNQMLIGATRKNTDAGNLSGSVYYFNYNGTEWVQQQTLLPEDATTKSDFGYSIDMDGEKAVIGSAFWSPGPSEGAAYVYTWDGTEWAETTKLTHSNPGWGDDFGLNVAINGTRVMAGAPWREINSLEWAGAAYIFHFEPMVPVAVAGEDIVVIEKNEVTLDGTGSFDYEGDKITYLWSAPEGVVLSDPASNQPTFMAPDLDVDELSREFVFSLVVNDNMFDSMPDTVVVKVINENLQPVANAGEDQAVMEGTQVSLDGSASSDPEGEDITYLWTAPEGVVLSDPTVANPTFTAPEVTENTDFTISLVVNDGVFDSETDEVVIKVLAILPVENLSVNEENGFMDWSKPGGISKVFRYDDGIYVDGFGGNTETVMCGAVHNYNALIEEVSWYLTGILGAHEIVTVAILGLTDDGLPDSENILYLNEEVPNIDDQWNVFTLPEPIEAPNGFYIGLSSRIFLGIGRDDGKDEPYKFIPGTHWINLDWNDPSGWVKPEDFGYAYNFLLRAHGYYYESMGSRFDESAYVRDVNSAEIGAGFSSIGLDTPIQTVHPLDACDRYFTDTYNVYLDGELVAEGITDTEYLLEELEGGHTYVAGVTAVYDEGESEVAEVEFTYVENILAPANVAIDNVEGTISWEDPTRSLTGYIVYLDSVVVDTLGLSAQEYTYDDLVYGESYTAGVSALYNGGQSEIVSIDFTYAGTAAGDDIPAKTTLNGNYPNPFNPETNISYSVKEDGDVTIEIYNIKGQKVRTLVNEEKTAGYYTATWKGKDASGKPVASGIYFYKMKSGEFEAIRKMILMK